jgi:ABC-type nitrate/sulfonate/bicarbonate transport system substrate-binding protein
MAAGKFVKKRGRGLPSWAILFLFLLFCPDGAETAVAPVGQLPMVTISVTPSIYALPILLVEKKEEWKDFGIQVSLKVHASGDDQLDRISANEWEVAVMDPFSAVKGGNEGNVAIVGVAGNLASQIPFLLGGRTPSPAGKAGEWLRGFLLPAGPQRDIIFLPACLVATVNYADTRKTLVIRWLEGYSRGIRMIQKNPEWAASQLKEFYQETLQREVPVGVIRESLEGAFYFDEKQRHEPLRKEAGKPSSLETAASVLTWYLKGRSALEGQAEPSEYILPKLYDQLSGLRNEAWNQLKTTADSIEAAAQAGSQVKEFRKSWEEAKMQIEDDRGCLAVIGILSNLQRSADQARVSSRRLRDFRQIEMGVAGILALYYIGYVFHRKKRMSALKTTR